MSAVCFPRLKDLTPRQKTEERQRRFVDKMLRRYLRGGQLDMLALDYRYWMAWRCGWDARAVSMRTIGRNGDGSPVLCEPEQSTFWRWWIRLHPGQRQQLMKISGRAKTTVSADAKEGQRREIVERRMIEHIADDQVRWKA